MPFRVDKSTKIYPTAKIVKSGSWGESLIEIGKNCLICDFVFIAVKRLIMADGAQVGMSAIITGGGNVRLGEKTAIGYGTKLIVKTDSVGGKYMVDNATQEERDVITGSITLEKGAYIGAGAVICVSKKCPNIVIGENSVIGALTYIDESIPPNRVVFPKRDLIMKERVIGKVKVMKLKTFKLDDNGGTWTGMVESDGV